MKKAASKDEQTQVAYEDTFDFHCVMDRCTLVVELSHMLRDIHGQYLWSIFGI
jgi:hypothetical protein